MTSGCNGRTPPQHTCHAYWDGAVVSFKAHVTQTLKDNGMEPRRCSEGVAEHGSVTNARTQAQGRIHSSRREQSTHEQIRGTAGGGGDRKAVRRVLWLRIGLGRVALQQRQDGGLRRVQLGLLRRQLRLQLPADLRRTRRCRVIQGGQVTSLGDISWDGDCRRGSLHQHTGMQIQSRHMLGS